MSERFAVEPGHRFPTGASVLASGVNFSMFSRNATRAWLRLYRDALAAEPLFEVELDPHLNRTFFFWHVLVEGAYAGLHYTWRVDGPKEPRLGFRFDARNELLDPWARIVAPQRWNRKAAQRGERSAIRAVVAERDLYDWEDDEVLERPLEDAVIYELHVGGFTRHPSSGAAAPGTFKALVDKIPYLVSLGVTDVELLPVMAFDEQDVPDGVAARGLGNYWGYSTYGFFAPHPGYAATADARNEFRDLVKALHRAGIGVILDVVLNHTSEGGADGVVIGFKGFGNEFFYHLDPADKRRYRDYTGCGNTVNCNHPLVARYLLQCLEFWVREMHVDGFRFDLASVLSRGEDGAPAYHAPLLWSIEFSGPLSAVHLIAEAWDAAGLHQVGDFPGFRWAEWNGLFRDDVRRFLRGDAGMIGAVATRIAGSADLYAGNGRHPSNSINFVTCHDGFTLYDLVSYERKHNEANGEANRDGSDHDLAWNSGVEGPADDDEILRLRERRCRSFLTVLFLSQGVPMLTAGDEVLRTQQGNNNAYCQNNALSWLDWRFDDSAAAMLRFTRELVALRKRHRSLRRRRFFAPGDGDDAEIRWYGETLEPPRWNDAEARVLCFTLAGLEPEEPALHVMLNMSPRPKSLPLPPVGGRRWLRIVDSALAPPGDVIPEGALVARAEYALAAFGAAVFEASGAQAGASATAASGGNVTTID